MKGVILAGGKGTRLQPATFAMNKHMIPVLNKPMILYPLETLKSHMGAFADFLGDGSNFGVQLTYRVQKEAGGIAQALNLAKDFAGDEQIAVILGDNIFENQFSQNFEPDRAYIYLKYVAEATRFGVYMDGRIVEKPKIEGAALAVTGLYIYPPEVFDILPKLSPSGRGEYEITDVNNAFLDANKCLVRQIHGFWSDAGTPSSLAQVTKWAHETNN
jgi:glucose-1-phosphate thymidylyltransferase